MKKLLPWVATRLRDEGTAKRYYSQPSSRSPTSGENEVSKREDLPSAQENRRSQAVKRFSHIMDNVQANVFIAGQRLNDLTGYSGIEAMKKDIEVQGQC